MHKSLPDYSLHVTDICKARFVLSSKFQQAFTSTQCKCKLLEAIEAAEMILITHETPRTIDYVSKHWHQAIQHSE